MLTKARSNAERSGATNVEFRFGEIEHLPVENGAVDVVLSNCVVNLSPSKAQVFREAFRVLRPGGRLAILDIVATVPIPELLANDLAAWTGCVSGASRVSDLRNLLAAAGFEQIRIDVKPESRENVADWFPDTGAEEIIASATIEAVKPVR